MSFVNLLVLIRMCTDLKVYRAMLKLYKLFRKDKEFSIIKFLKLIFGMMKKERIIKYKDDYIISSFTPSFPTDAFFTIFKNGKNGENSVFRDFAHVQRRAPITTFIKVTSKCNYKCYHCCADMSGIENDLTTDEWIRIIKSLQTLGTSYIGITGGEPLLRKDINKIIASINPSLSASVLFTNGYLLTKEMADTLKGCGLYAVSVSIDSHNKQVHDRIRNHENAFDYALKAVENSRKAGLYTIVQSVLPKEMLSKNDLYKLFRLVKKHGAHEIRLHQPAPIGTLLTNEKLEDVIFSDEDRKLLFEVQHKANKKLWGFPKVTSFPYSEGREKFGCAAGILHTYVTNLGEMTPCDFIPMSFGNILKEDIREVYNRMACTIGGTSRSCLSYKLYKEFQGKQLPIPKENQFDICKYINKGEYADCFSSLQ